MKLLYKCFNGRLVEDLQVLRDGLRHNLSKAHVVIRRTREGMVSGAHKFITIPEETAGSTEFLQRDRFETFRTEFIAHLVHLCVQEKVLCVAGWWHIDTAPLADEVNFSSLIVAGVVWANPYTMFVAQAVVRELVMVLGGSFRSHNVSCEPITSKSKGKPWLVFSLVQKL
jgi:hypothetical protein